MICFVLCASSCDTDVCFIIDISSPTSSSLDVKKSSYKKLSKFLAAMQERHFIQVKELSKGVESIVSIDQEHSELVWSSFNFPVRDLVLYSKAKQIRIPKLL